MRRSLLLCLLVSVLSVTAFVTATPQDPPAGQLPVGRGRAGGPPEPRTGTGLVIGRVVDGGSGNTVPGAIVTISGGGAAPRRVQVEDGGRFLFRDLPAGEFSLMAAKAGYVGGAVGQRSPGGPLRPLELLDGERLTNLTLRLWKAGAIGGSVFDESGEPIVGIRVMLAERRLMNGKWRIAPSDRSTALTDDRGTYRFGTVAPGDYVVVARTSEEDVARGLMSLVSGDPSTIIPFATRAMAAGRPEDLITVEAAMRVYAPVFHPAASTPSEASVVRVGSGETKLGIDIRMKLAAIAPLAGSLAGLPVPAEGNPQVRLLLADPGGDEFEVTRAIDTRNGRFVFLGVPTGRYLLHAYVQPRVTQPVNPGAGGRGRGTAPLPMPTSPAYWGMMPVVAGTDDTSNVTLVMRPGARMTGRVEFDGTAPRPEQLGGRSLITPVPETNVPGQIRGIVDAEGRFETTSLPPGKYRLRVAPMGAWQPKSAIVGGRDLIDQAVDLTETDLEDIVITFTDRPFGSINGIVRGTQSTPDPDALVAIFPADPALRTDFSGNGRRMRLARTTRAGVYAIPGLPPGEYLVVAGGDDMFETWLEPSALARLATRATRVDIAEGAAQKLDLTSGAR